jgi:hypothetical protein
MLPRFRHNTVISALQMALDPRQLQIRFLFETTILVFLPIEIVMRYIIGL